MSSDFGYLEEEFEGVVAGNLYMLTLNFFVSTNFLTISSIKKLVLVKKRCVIRLIF